MKQLEVRAGVNNVLDKDPPIVPRSISPETPDRANSFGAYELLRKAGLHRLHRENSESRLAEATHRAHLCSELSLRRGARSAPLPVGPGGECPAGCAITQLPRGVAPSGPDGTAPPGPRRRQPESRGAGARAALRRAEPCETGSGASGRPRSSSTAADRFSMVLDNGASEFRAHRAGGCCPGTGPQPLPAGALCRVSPGQRDCPEPSRSTRSPWVISNVTLRHAADHRRTLSAEPKEVLGTAGFLRQADRHRFPSTTASSIVPPTTATRPLGFHHTSPGALRSRPPDGPGPRWLMRCTCTP